MPLYKNLAAGKLASNISASTTTLPVYVGNGSSTTIKNVWPGVPFYVTIMPENPVAGVPNSLDSEIVKVTAVGTDANGNTTLTATRGQRDTTAKAFTTGAIVSNATYADDTPCIDDDGEVTADVPWVSGSMIENGAVGDEKIDWASITHGWVKIADTLISPASGTVTYDVPVDLQNYRKVMLYMHSEPSSGSIEWVPVQALNSAKEVIGTLQVGIELPGGENYGRFICRDGNEIVALGSGAYASMQVKAIISRAAVANYLTFSAEAFGGGDISTVRAQSLQGRIMADCYDLRYVRFTLKNPQANGYIIVMGLK